jgi:hypothetical protein
LSENVLNIGSQAFGYYYNDGLKSDYVINGFKIYGTPYSYGERYANENGIEFIDLSTVHTHTTVVDESVAPTCTENGLTEGSHCSECGEVFVAQEVVPATGHEVIIDVAVAPTEDSTGLTEGQHCSVCDEVLIAQEVIPALTSVKIVSAPVSLYVKGTAKINATVNNGDGKTTYSSSNTKVAKVDKNGKVTGVKKGTATITVTNNGVSKDFKVTVKNPTLSKKSVKVTKNHTVTVKIKGKIKGVNNSYVNTKYAKVISSKSASTLKIKGLKKGNTTLKIKVSGVTLKLKVNVK